MNNPSPADSSIQTFQKCFIISVFGISVGSIAGSAALAYDAQLESFADRDCQIMQMNCEHNANNISSSETRGLGFFTYWNYKHWDRSRESDMRVSADITVCSLATNWSLNELDLDWVSRLASMGEIVQRMEFLKARLKKLIDQRFDGKLDTLYLNAPQK